MPATTRSARSVRAVLIVACVPVLTALAGCGGGGAPGAANLVVTYTDDAGAQEVTVSAQATTCDDASPRLFSSKAEDEASSAIAILVDDTGAATFRVRLGDDREFIATARDAATDGAVQVTELAGVVVQAGTAGLQTQVDDEAVLTGSLTCPA